MLVAIAAVIAIACGAASVRRLVFVLRATALDPRMLERALEPLRAGGSVTFAETARAIERVPEARWEKDLLAAMRGEGPARAAEINEQLLELDWRASRWARVPRVAASVCMSIGFLLATFALREGLLDPNPEDIGLLITRAANVVAIGFAGAMVCATVHLRAGKLARARLAAVDALVEKLESLPR